jgi:hypothetical protein
MSISDWCHSSREGYTAGSPGDGVSLRRAIIFSGVMRTGWGFGQESLSGKVDRLPEYSCGLPCNGGTPSGQASRRYF